MDTQRAAHGEVRAVGFNSEFTCILRSVEYCHVGDGVLQGVESLLVSREPFPRNVSGQLVERAGNLWEVFDELMIEVHKTKESLQVSLLRRSVPVPDSFDLLLFHPHLASINYHPQVINHSLLKVTLLGLSNLVNIVVPFSLSMSSEMSGKGYLFLIIIKLRYR